MIIWLRKFISQHKEVVPTLQDQDKPPENNQVNYADVNKENEFKQVENPLVSQRKECLETKHYKSATSDSGVTNRLRRKPKPKQS